MKMATLFIGNALCDVDADGNVTLPGFVSDALAAAPAGTELLVSRHEGDACLVGYGSDHLPRLHRMTERRRIADERAGRDTRGHRRRARRTFGWVERMPRSAGAATLPPAMRAVGRIDRRALFIGAGDNFEIWNPDVALESGDESFRALAGHHGRSAAAEGTKGGQ
jgi:MraZ protein